MIQLKRDKSGNYELSDKKQTVVFSGSDIKLGEYSIASAGEYERSGVEVVYGTSAALLVWEKLQIVYVFSLDKTTSFEKNQFSGADVILVADSIEKINKDVMSQLNDAYDPRLVIFSIKSEIDPTFAASIKPTEQPSIKLSSQTLVTEGKDYNILQ